MFKKNYEIAGKVIEINSIYNKVHDYCAGYVTDKPADFSVETNQNDIEFERMKSEKEDIAEGRTIRKFTDEYLEELSVYRKISEKMVDYDTILFHGSVIAADGKGFLFTARSGTGKSTHTRLWREVFGDKVTMVNDDKPLIHIGDNAATVYGTPYNGKHRLGNNMSVPLKAICILTRAEKNSIVKITKSQAYSMLLQQVYRPSDPLKMKKTLELIDRLAEKITLYRMGCNMEREAAVTAYNGMKD